MDTKYLKELNSNPEILKNYDVLKRSGLWDYIDTMSTEIKSFEELLSEAIEIFNQQSINELILFVISKLLNKFIPSYLAFIIQEKAAATDSIKIFCFRNMKPVDQCIFIKSLEPYQSFFLKNNNHVTYSTFVENLNDKAVSDALLPLSPEILVPITGLGGFHGFIVFGRKILDNDYTSTERDYIERLMKFTSISLQNNIHYQNAITDLKTKLFNHSYFIRRVEEELSRVKRYNSELALLIMDVDKFKQFNDTYGHLAGDEVLINIAATLKNMLRQEDIAARFGGEEFTVLLVQCNSESANLVAERIRKAIENLEIIYSGQKLKVTISIGGIHITKNYKYSAAEIIEKADACLYKSKKNGRNQTTFYKAKTRKPSAVSKTSTSKKNKSEK